MEDTKVGHVPPLLSLVRRRPPLSHLSLSRGLSEGYVERYYTTATRCRAAEFPDTV
jgi:hypothetical protein